MLLPSSEMLHRPEISAVPYQRHRFAPLAFHSLWQADWRVGGHTGLLVYCMKRRQRQRETPMGPVPVYAAPTACQVDSEGKLPPPPEGYEYRLSYGQPAPAYGTPNAPNTATSPVPYGAPPPLPRSTPGQTANYSHAYARPTRNSRD